MTKLNSKLLGGATVAFLAMAVAAPAQAQVTKLYSGGGTLAEKIYRDVFNCYGDQAGGEFTAGLGTGPSGCNGVPAYNANRTIFYVGVGSGNGLTAFTTGDPTQLTQPTGGSARTPDAVPVNGTTAYGSFYGTGVGAGWTPSATGTAFPKMSFAGSDDPLSSAKLATYNTNSATKGWGQAIQFPGLVTTVAIPYKPSTGGTGLWSEQGKDLHTYGASSRLQFSTNTLCGIFTGAITDWSSSEIKADNGNKALVDGPLDGNTHPITVVYRPDGSGTTFLFTNALIHQCGSQSNPRTSAVGGIAITHPVPDSWLSDNGITNTAGIGADNIGGSNNNFFFTIAAAHRPANFTAAAAGGSGGIKAAINSTQGAISYISPDFTSNGVWVALTKTLTPFDSTGPKAANLQTWLSFNNHLTAKFVVASPAAGTATMNQTNLKPPSFAAGSCVAANSTGVAPHILAADGKCGHNPLNWGVTNPLPIGAAAYPMGGFTFIDMYQCYAAQADVDALVSKVATPTGQQGLWMWYFGATTINGSHVKNEMARNGFSLVPGTWSSAAKTLLTSDAVTKVAKAGTAKTPCAAISGGA
jgi:ABC-type phosphate transport system substrate-binding protein